MSNANTLGMLQAWTKSSTYSNIITSFCFRSVLLNFHILYFIGVRVCARHSLHKQKTMSSEAREKHRYPGEFQYKGVTYKPYVSIEHLRKFEEEDLPLGNDAVFVISYPKSGKRGTNNKCRSNIRKVILVCLS